MGITPPPPLVSAFGVIELKPAIHPKTRTPILLADRPRVVNTLDMEYQVLMPGLYIVEWQELHYSVYWDSSGAPRFQEQTVTRSHIENQRRIERVKLAWEWAESHPHEAFKAPDMLSLEQELMNLGWNFRYEPSIGPLYNPEVDNQLHCIIPASPIEDIQEPLAPSPFVPQPSSPYQVEQPPVGTVDRLELKIDRLAGLMEQFMVGVLNANGNHSGTSELHPSEPTARNNKRPRAEFNRPVAATASDEPE